MRTTRVPQMFIAATIAVAFAGCRAASSVPEASSAAPPGGPAVSTMRHSADVPPLQFVPGKAPKSNVYQWVSTLYSSNGAVEYDYPKGTGPIGEISGTDAQGECTSGKSTFWIVNSGNNDLAEYTYNGKKLIKTLSISDSGEPAGCAVNSTNGDIAVTLLGEGAVILFKGGKQKGETVEDGLAETYFDGYDAKGDLFVDGVTAESTALVEMAAGSKTFENVSLPNTIKFPGSVQWDGKYVTVNDQEGGAIYRYAIADDVATLKGTVELTGTSDCSGTWIAQPYVFCADAGLADAPVFKYPGGGDSIATLSGSGLPISVVQVSK